MEESLDFLIREARRFLIKRVGLLLGNHGIADAAWFPLRVLYEREGLTQRELSRILGLLDAATGTILEGLEQAELVKRVRNPDDRRKINVFLTPAGVGLAEQVFDYMHDLNAIITAGMKPEESAQLSRLLLRAQKNLALTPSLVGPQS